MGLGRLEGLLLRKGRLVVSRGFVARGCGWLVRVGIGDTLSAACVWWWWVPPFCVLGACGGGMLSGFWGSAPWLPDLLSASLFVGGGGGCGWVGCELYSGREHLTVRFLRQVS